VQNDDLKSKEKNVASLVHNYDNMRRFIALHDEIKRLAKELRKIVFG